MAIQNRRGNYSDFDPDKMVPGEIAVVLSGDPNADSGRSVYICFQPGVVKRFVTYQDFEDEIQNATEDIQAQFTAEIRVAINNAITATSAANAAQEAANTAAEAANAAAEAASAYVLGDISNKTVTFTEASAVSSIQSGESTATLFGKIKKHLSSLGESVSSLNTKLDDYAAGTVFFQNLFAYWGSPPTFGAKITGAITYVRKNQKHYTLDFSVMLSENTAAGSEAHDSFTSWGISADQIKSQILNNKDIVSIEGQCDIFVDNQRTSTSSGGGLNGFGAIVEYNKAENEHVIRISRYFNEYGAKGAWSLRHVPVGTVFSGRMEITTE